jgi:hypothetical protein
MTVRRFAAAACALGLGLMLGSCSPFSGFVSDHWPHFAGGEPGGLPPRPGDPGYAAFISHGDPNQIPETPTGTAQSSAPLQQAPIMQQRPAVAGPPPAAGAAPPSDGMATEGGLY